MHELLISNIGAFISLVLGVIALVLPHTISKFISIEIHSKEGLAELRATYGGFFIGLAGFALITQTETVFMAMGMAWLCAAFVRAFTLLTGSFSLKNLGGVIVESSIGAMCLWNTM